MKYSVKGSTPPCLAEYQSMPSTCGWQPTYAGFRDKATVLGSLLAEQGHVCAYCGQAIGSDSSHIEHYFCQASFSAQQLDYDNMFASCGPPKKRAQPQICGAAKGNLAPPSPCILPSDPACEQRFRYGLYGTISGADATARDTIEWLNLTDSTLEIERAKVLADIERNIMDGTITAANKADEISLWRMRDAKGRLPSFGHVAARYIEDEV